MTGPQCFRYYHINDNVGLHTFRMVHEELKSKEVRKPLLSDNYTCHAWDQASRLVVCTDKGEIMICDYSGLIQTYLTDAPFDNRLDCIWPTTKALVVGGENGFIWSYELTKSHDRPYQLL